MAKWLSCQLEDAPDQPVMVNLEYVVMMVPHPDQSGKTMVELASGRTFWILNAATAVSDAIEAAPDGAMVDAVATVEVAPIDLLPTPGVA